MHSRKFLMTLLFIIFFMGLSTNVGYAQGIWILTHQLDDELFPPDAVNVESISFANPQHGEAHYIFTDHGNVTIPQIRVANREFYLREVNLWIRTKETGEGLGISINDMNDKTIAICQWIDLPQSQEWLPVNCKWTDIRSQYKVKIFGTPNLEIDNISAIAAVPVSIVYLPLIIDPTAPTH